MSIPHILLSLLICFIWANSYLVDKALLNHIPPYFILTAEGMIVGLITLTFAPSPPLSLRKLIPISISWTLTYSAYLTAVKLGINMNIALITSKLGVITSAIFATFLYKEHITINAIIGIVIALSGIFLLSGHPNVFQNPIAFGFMLIYAIFWGLYNTLSSRTAKNISVLHLTGWIMLISIPQTFLLSYFFEDWSNLSLFNFSDFIYLLYLSLFAIIFCFSAWMYLLVHNPVYKIACFSLIMPLIGIIEGYFIFNNSIDNIPILSTCLVTIGLILTLIPPAKLFSFKTIAYEKNH